MRKIYAQFLKNMSDGNQMQQYICFSNTIAAHYSKSRIGTEVTTTDAVGISGDDMEALAFAWLAWRTLAGLPGNLPSVTGASQETVLGAIFPANP